MEKFYWSKIQDPNKWVDESCRSFWCPKFLQPLVMWYFTKVRGAKHMKEWELESILKKEREGLAGFDGKGKPFC